MHQPDLRSSLTAASLALALVSSAHAAPTAPASPSAAPVSLAARVDPSPFAVAVTQPESPIARAGDAVSMLAYQISHVNEVPAVELNGVHYRPRRRFSDRVDASSVSQIHAGFFDPDGERGEQFLIGVRGGPMLDSHVQLGLGVDWIHKTEKTTSVTSSQIGPGGTPIEVRQDLARASSHLFPVMAYMQLSADDDLPVIPYFGVAGGYQVLLLSAEDFTTGNQYDGTFGGWGWQIWGGAALPLSGRTRLTGEVYVNGGELTRDVNDNLLGSSYRETVDVDGAGLRFGLAWGF